MRRIELKGMFSEDWRSPCRHGSKNSTPVPDLYNIPSGRQQQTMIKPTELLPYLPRAANDKSLDQASSSSDISCQADADLLAVRRLPLPVAAVSQLAEPGACVAAWVHGMRVLLTSGDGVDVRAFAPSGSAEGGAQNLEDTAQELPCVKRLGLVWVIAAPVSTFDWAVYFGALGAEMIALGFDDSSLGIHQRSFVQPSNWKRVLEARLDGNRNEGDTRESVHAAVAQGGETAVREAAGDHQRIVKRKRRAATRGDPGATPGCSSNSEFTYLFFPCTLMVWEGDHYNMVTVSPGDDGQSCAVNSWMMVPGQFRWRAAEHWERSDKLFWGEM